MKALVYIGDKKIELKEIENPKIIDSKDAIVKVQLSSICTSDFHIINGQVPRANKNIVLGHEFVGEVVKVGNEVKKLNIGDRVSANCITFCGECYYCKNGFINNCEKGGWEIGCRINGCQAEYVRVPFADMSLNIIPHNVTYKNALFVGDILASGYFGAELCEIKKNDTVAVIGAGPVGLCAMMSARAFGAKKIIAIDINKDRLNIAKTNNLADFFINPNKVSNIEEYIKDINNGRLSDGTIEAAGGENTFDLAWRIARPNSVVALVAMYEKPQILPLNIMYGKNLIFKTGGVDAVHSDEILKLISQGKLNTDFLITHTIKLDNILRGYEIFDKKEDNCIKIAVEPIQ
ncbi:alcohol dehydrogenase [Brachyspira pilosicoli]|uniref:alcohol dehydrogenase n=1 Tax=Brachyspira pilosicoli TaxID=52584 RepID=UPI001C675E2F|nr:alcohol dehydrogenase [Brachyspira pilosicoli]MBW5397011.1 alcohol dehydrogenase [Brachyspira pilosicoli]